LQTYHGSLSTKTKTRFVTIGGVPQPRVVERSTMKYEGWGLSLNSILQGAHDFVTLDDPNEFLLLKFDKCKNWELIAEAAVATLGNTMYHASGDVNTKTLEQLKGKVVVLFAKEGMDEIRDAATEARYQLNQRRPRVAPNTPSLDSVVRWQNLQKEPIPAYDPISTGLKYFGGFGDSMLSPTTSSKIKKNLAKQVSNMTAARSQDRRVLRMMYWTTTGVFQNIEDRNREMWQAPNLRNFLTAWDAGVSTSVMAHAPLTPGQVLVGGMPVATQIRNYFPNIIMIDFADQAKGDLIFGLNQMTTTQLPEALRLLGLRSAS
jgi:hypothetical protein